MRFSLSNLDSEKYQLYSENVIDSENRTPKVLNGESNEESYEALGVIGSSGTVQVKL